MSLEPLQIPTTKAEQKAEIRSLPVKRRFADILWPMSGKSAARIAFPISASAAGLMLFREQIAMLRVVDAVLMAICVGAFTIVAIDDLAKAKAAGRRQRGQCFACGYDLTANVSGTCPECGSRTGQ